MNKSGSQAHPGGRSIQAYMPEAHCLTGQATASFSSQFPEQFGALSPKLRSSMTHSIQLKQANVAMSQ